MRGSHILGNPGLQKGGGKGEGTGREGKEKTGSKRKNKKKKRDGKQKGKGRPWESSLHRVFLNRSANSISKV